MRYATVCQSTLPYLYLCHPFWKHRRFTCTHSKHYAHALVIPLPVIVIVVGVGVVVVVAVLLVVIVAAVIAVLMVVVVAVVVVVVVVDQVWESFCVCLGSCGQIRARVIFITLFRNRYVANWLNS